ncbi:CDP-diacylglycerol--glycerol-3-phosphate 3-phosphatidyltransferase [Patescibacteria group bacterium]|nr:CDP-diacylglycerol--glycerol-3-phosphate 3-phosphatidyltransferase [Patescibacteria group bacterium]
MSIHVSQKRGYVRHVPNILTGIRFLCAATILWCAASSDFFGEWTALSLFVVGSITDFLDGYLARKYALHTKIGAILDPIADKILVLSFIVFLVAHAPVGVVDIICFGVIGLREFYVDAMRWMSARKGERLASSSVGKWKAAAQMVALTLYGFPIESLLLSISSATMLGIATVLTIVSAVEYTFPAWFRRQVQSFPTIVRVFRSVDGIRRLWA